MKIKLQKSKLKALSAAAHLNKKATAIIAAGAYEAQPVEGGDGPFETLGYCTGDICIDSSPDGFCTSEIC